MENTSVLINAVIALLSLILGGGGYAALVRARGQNRSDIITTQAERISRLETRTDLQDTRNDELSEINARLQGSMQSFESERNSWNERFAIQRKLIDELNMRVSRLDVTEKENVELRHQLQVEMAKVSFLQREVESLRIESAQLRRELDELRKRQESNHGC